MNVAASEVILSRALAVGAGGFLGASLRYLVGAFVARNLPTLFPLATFLINVSGCFGIGFLAVLAEQRLAGGHQRAGQVALGLLAVWAGAVAARGLS